MRRLSPSNFPWLDAWCAVKRRFGSSLATVHKKNRKKVMKSAILKIEPPLERQEDLLFNETKKNCLCLFYTTKMADTKQGKLGRFFFFTDWQILDCEINFAFISSGFYYLNSFILQTNECGLLRISLKMDSFCIVLIFLILDLMQECISISENRMSEWRYHSIHECDLF